MPLEVLQIILNSNNNKATRNFIGVWELIFVTFSGFFLEFFTPSTLKGHNFLNFIMFLDDF